MRAGTMRSPCRSPYPAAPKRTSGSVPIAIVITPFPPPCRIVNTGAAGAPKAASVATPAGCASVATRAEKSGCTWRTRLNSRIRAATCAGPTSAAAAIAAGRLARLQNARQVRGHGRAAEPARGEDERKRDHCSHALLSAAVRRRVRCRFRMRLRLWQVQVKRQPDHEMRRGPDVACDAPAELRPCTRKRPAHRAREAGDERDAGDRAARIRPIDTRERGKRRFVESRAHARADHEPAADEHASTARRAEDRKARREDQTRAGEHLPPAEEVDQPTGERPERRGEEQSGRKSDEHPCRCPARRPSNSRALPAGNTSCRRRASVRCPARRRHQSNSGSGCEFVCPYVRISHPDPEFWSAADLPAVGFRDREHGAARRQVAAESGQRVEGLSKVEPSPGAGSRGRASCRPV